MAQEWAKSFLHSKPWLRCRRGYIDHRISIDGGVCEVCRNNLGYIVHHKIRLTPENIHDPTISLNWEYLSYECKDCHDQHDGHGVGRKTTLTCIFDANGDPIAINPVHERNRL